MDIEIAKKLGCTVVGSVATLAFMGFAFFCVERDQAELAFVATLGGFTTATASGLMISERTFVSLFGEDD